VLSVELVSTRHECSRNLKLSLFRSETRLQQKNSSLGKEKIQKSAQCIEELLFRETKKRGSTQGYADTSNLDERLAPVLRRLSQRKAGKAATATATVMSPQERRLQTLRRSLGSDDLYNRAMHLVQLIQRLRLQHASVACSGQTLASPVYNIFFNVNLVQAVEDVPLRDLPDISTNQWQGWIREAESMMEIFQKWRQEHQG
jgi:hypothetical protein